MTVLHILAPKPTEVGVIVIDCPTCARHRKALFRSYEWYGATVICSGCGERWEDGEMIERPFARAWRRRNVEYVRNELGRVGVQV